jgi:1-acyl-sn-glycerol-3-phosphate acyltransferase
MASQIGDWPFMGMLFRSSGSIALDRDVPVRAAAALDEAERAIREDGLSVWMFAEGTRGKIPGKLGPFKRGRVPARGAYWCARDSRRDLSTQAGDRSARPSSHAA